MTMMRNTSKTTDLEMDRMMMKKRSKMMMMIMMMVMRVSLIGTLYRLPELVVRDSRIGKRPKHGTIAASIATAFAITTTEMTMMMMKKKTCHHHPSTGRSQGPRVQGSVCKLT
jgi:hypothetical protein